MERAELLDTCLSVTGFFEGGEFTPRYSNVAGDFDGQGMSVGCLQWAGKAGSLSLLMREILERMEPAEADAYFTVPATVSTLASLKGPQAYQFLTANFVQANGKNNPVIPEAKAEWEVFLDTDASKEAQKELAEHTFDRALDLADEYVHWDAGNPRVIAFFFDLLNQSGGMSNKRGNVVPIDPSQPIAWKKAADLAMTSRAVRVSNAWTKIAQAEGTTTQALLWYAFARASLSLPQWKWNACVRRGTIATRVGFVNGQWVDFTAMMP